MDLKQGSHDSLKDVPPLVRPRTQVARQAEINNRPQIPIERPVADPPSSPTADDVRRALQAQTAPSKKNV